MTESSAKGKARWFIPVAILAVVVALVAGGVVPWPSNSKDDLTKAGTDLPAPASAPEAARNVEETSKEAEPDPPPPARIDIGVTVKTGDVRLAGTDANIFLVIRGSTGTTDPVRLNDLEDLAGHKDPFEQGHQNRFVLRNAKNVGEVAGVSVSFDATGMGSGWFLESITIEGAAGGPWTTAPKRWFEVAGTYEFE